MAVSAAAAPGGKLRAGGILPAAWLFFSLLLLLNFLLGEFSFQVRNRQPFSLPWWLLLAAWIPLAAWSMRRFTSGKWSTGEFHRVGSYWVPLVPVGALLLLMASNLRKLDWYYFLDEYEIWRLLLLAPLFILGMELVERRRLGRLIYPLLLLAAQAWLALTLWRTFGGQPPYSDDHPSFLYRIWIAAQAFPRAWFWNPGWNGGYVGQELVSTGAYALGLLAWPLVSLLGAERAYLPLLILLFVVAVPWIVRTVVRGLGMGPLAAWATAFLCLGTNRFYFVNLLSYGTTPALLFSCLAVAVWALLYMAVERGCLGWRRWLALAVCLNLMALYPGTALILSPVGVALLLSLPRWNRRVWLFLAAQAAVLAVLNGPSIYRYLARPQVAQFLAHQASSAGLFVDPSMATLSGALSYVSPLLLAAGFLGLLWPGEAAEFRWLLPPVGLYLAMIAVGPAWKPHLQLHRMLIPLAFFLALPAASVIRRTTTGWTMPAAVMRGVTGAFCCVVVLNTGAVFENRGKEVSWTMDSTDRWTASWLAAHVPEEGRVFFGGPVLHEYGNSHIAWLQAASGRGLIAGHYYHYESEVGDVNPVPPSFRGSRAKNRRYFELMGVTHVVTNRRNWKKVLGREMGMRLERQFGATAIYSTGIAPGFFLEGSGRARPAINRIEVSLEQPADRVVLKFLWQPGLVADGGASLEPVEIAPDLTFIGVRPRGAKAFTIRYRG